MPERARILDTAKVGNLLLFSAPKETYDGIWADQALRDAPKDHYLRVMGIFFAALKPKGWLFFSVEMRPEIGGADDLSSLLRQNGFQILVVANQPNPSSLIGFLAQRI